MSYLSAEPTPEEYPSDSTTEEILIRIPKGMLITISCSSSTLVDSSHWTPGQPTGTSQSQVELMRAKLSQISLRSFHDQAMDDSYDRPPVEVALALLMSAFSNILDQVEHESCQ